MDLIYLSGVNLNKKQQKHNQYSQIAKKNNNLPDNISHYFCFVTNLNYYLVKQYGNQLILNLEQIGSYL